MTSRQDRRRERERAASVYRWEDTFVAPHDRTKLPFSAAEGMVRSLWADQGLLYPPIVERLPKRHRSLGLAHRTVIGVQHNIPTWVLLHELAHAMTAVLEGEDDGHGPLYMGNYCRMLARYLRLDRATLEPSLLRAGIQVCWDAQPDSSIARA